MNDCRTYAERLKDPRWQRKRLEVLDRDGFTCQHCGDDTSTLHVHHRYYVDGGDPWDVPVDALVTLCEYCHEVETELLRDGVARLIKSMKVTGCDGDTFGRIADALLRTATESSLDWNAVCSLIESAMCRHVRGHAAAVAALESFKTPTFGDAIDRF